MALELNFKVCQAGNCESFDFIDITGDYDVATNPTGWGTPNIEEVDVLTSTLTIVAPDTLTYVIDLTGIVPPGTTTNILSSQVGKAVGGKLDDGVYTMTWEITTASDTVTVEKDFLFYCNIKCRVFAALLELDFDCVPCEYPEADRALEVWTYLKSLEMAARWNRQSKFNNLMNHITKLLDSLCTNC